MRQKQCCSFLSASACTTDKTTTKMIKAIRICYQLFCDSNTLAQDINCLSYFWKSLLNLTNIAQQHQKIEDMLCICHMENKTKIIAAIIYVLKITEYAQPKSNLVSKTFILTEATTKYYKYTLFCIKQTQVNSVVERLLWMVLRWLMVPSSSSSESSLN